MEINNGFKSLMVLKLYKLLNLLFPMQNKGCDVVLTLQKMLPEYQTKIIHCLIYIVLKELYLL